MTERSRKGVFWGVIITMSLAGVLATIGHYAFQPPVEEAIKHGLGPSPSWFSEQMPRYRQHFVMTFLHVVPGFLLMVLSPLQLVPGLRKSYPGLHRIVGRVFVSASFILVISGAVIAFVMPFDGALESWGSLFIAIGFMFAMLLGVHAIRQKNVSRHRVYMSYMLAFAYAPITMRFVLFILTGAFGLDGQAYFAESMLVGVLLDLFIVQRWLQMRPSAVSAVKHKASMLAGEVKISG